MPVLKRQGTAVLASLQQFVSAMEAPEGGVALFAEAWGFARLEIAYHFEVVDAQKLVSGLRTLVEGVLFNLDAKKLLPSWEGGTFCLG